MKLKQLLEKLDYDVILGSDDTDVSDLTDDSRQAKPGSLFIARDGHSSHGKDYIGDAIAQGAIAIIAQTPPPSVALASPTGQPVTWITTRLVNQTFGGILADRFFDHPGQKLSLIGITGTNGKTTTAYLIRHLLETTGVHCGMIGTVEIDDGQNTYPAQLTTPGAIEFVRLLATMVKHKCKAVAAEVSSHALHQGRVAGLKFDVALFTNLTGDHLDYHHTMEEYADAKALLFDSLPASSWAILNADDPYAARMVRDSKARELWCTLAPQPAEHHRGRVTQATVIKLMAGHSRARFDGPWGSCETDLPLVGRHNISNVLQAITAANVVTGMSRTLSTALEHCPPLPGRLEPVFASGENQSSHEAHTSRMPAVLVDYAHTHDALENVLNSLRPVCEGKLVVVFGCGGDRDRTKRPRMAKAACELADQVIVTSDNPRTENPQAIIDEILAGVPKDRAMIVHVEVDRAKAIDQAIAQASARDVVLIAGKGHEDYQIVGTTKRHFDDREHARRSLEKRRGETAPSVRC